MRGCYLERVKGDTWCVVTEFCRIPMFRLGGGEVVLFDSGLWMPGGDDLLTLLDKEGLRVVAVVTSHVHIDHVGYHAALRERYAAVIYMSLYDAGIAGKAGVLRSCFFGLSARTMRRYAESLFTDCDRIIRPGDGEITINGARFGVLRLAGHAPEHLGFTTPDNVAYLGDTLLSENVLESVRIPFTTDCSADIDTKNLVGTLRYDGYIVAHNGVYTDITDLAQKNVRMLMEKISVVQQLITDCVSFEHIVSEGIKAFGVAWENRKILIATRNIRAFVDYLLDTGRIAERLVGGVIKYVPVNV